VFTHPPAQLLTNSSLNLLHVALNCLLTEGASNPPFIKLVDVGPLNLTYGRERHP
jgi:hypothetical protein